MLFGDNQGFPRDVFSSVSVWYMCTSQVGKLAQVEQITHFCLLSSPLIANPPARSTHPLTSDLAQPPFNTLTTLEELLCVCVCVCVCVGGG